MPIHPKFNDAVLKTAGLRALKVGDKIERAGVSIGNRGWWTVKEITKDTHSPQGWWVKLERIPFAGNPIVKGLVGGTVACTYAKVDTCTYPDCKCIVSTSTSQPEAVCPLNKEAP